MITVIITLLLLFYVCYKIYTNKYNDVNQLPGPSLLQITREVYFNRSSEGIVKYLETLNERYGPVVKLRLNPLKPVIITTDMEYLKKIFKRNDHHLSPSVNEMEFAGEGISTTKDYNVFMADKHIIMKAINREYIANRLQVYDNKYDKLLTIIRENLGKPIDVQDQLRHILLDIMLNSFEHPGAELTEEERSCYNELKNRFFDLLLEKKKSIRMMGFLHRFTDNYKLTKKCSEDIKAFAARWLQRFKAVENQRREKHNLAYAMLDAGMPDRRVADNITSLIQGGQDTSIYPLCLTLLELSKQPELQRNLQEEIVSVIGPDVTTQITLDHLDKMSYLHSVVQESLRMYLPFPFIDRQLLYDFTIGNTRIPKGTIVMFNFPGILKSEQNFDDPLSFNPDRFLNDKVTSKEKKAFISFGYGVKICPGKDIAYAAMKLFIVKLFREFEVCPAEEHEMKVVCEFFYRSLNGIPIIFRKKSMT